MSNYIEIALLDNYHTTGELKQALFEISENPRISGVNLLPAILPKVKEFVPTNLLLSCPIDFPGNNLSIKDRQKQVIAAIKSGANTIDLPIHVPSYVNKKYIFISRELKAITKICNNYNVTLRIAIDTNIIDLKQILPMIIDSGVQYIFPSIGYPLLSMSDSLDIAYKISEMSHLRIILNPFVSKKTQLTFDNAYNIYGIRISNINFKNVLT